MGGKPENKPESIAVIGMACVFPGAQSPEELWQNILAGRRYFRKAPDERLPKSDYYDADPRAPGKTYCDQMAVITGWTFDALDFRIPPVTVNASDIAHWLALHTAREAVRDSGIDLESVDRTRAGVIIGNTLTGEFSRSHNLMFRWPYVERAIRRALGNGNAAYCDSLVEAVKAAYEAPLPEITEDSLPGNMSNTIAGRICNYFDFGGGSFTIDGACSSSLLSIANACSALVAGEMDIAVAGGVDISLDPFEVVGFAKTQALAADDIRPYDERASGLLPGEGCGIVILAREEDARKWGSRIRALIRGWGYSSDGSGSITAPEVEGQMRALQKAYARAGYPISAVGLVEGHGTGTTLGDKVEISAVVRVLEQSAGERVCRIGSIKSNIGHCKAAAGAAAFIKAVMAIDRKILPPTMGCERPNESFGAPLGRLEPCIRGAAWAAGDTPRRAAVSAMGFGGSNSHVTIEEANAKDVAREDELALLRSSRATELILLSAETREDLARQVNELIPVAGRICRAELTDMAAALSGGNHAGRFRVAVVAESPWRLQEALSGVAKRLGGASDIRECEDAPSSVFAGEAEESPSFVALFPGQGSQRLNMGRRLIEAYPFVSSLYDRAENAIRDVMPRGLRSYVLRDELRADEPTRKGWEKELKQTGIAQPAIVLSSLATLEVLSFFGLKPDVCVGHSLGEISALSGGGAYDAATAARMAAMRGNTMSLLKLDDTGGMAAIGADADKVEELLKPFAGSLVISNYNSPRQTVVSGACDSLDALAERCEKESIRYHRLPVSHAFHSSLVSPAATAFSQSLGQISFRPVTGTVISASAGGIVPANADLRWQFGEQIRRPVRFTTAVALAAERRPSFWVEVGPGGVLTGLVRDIFGPDNVECLPTDLKGDDSLTLLNHVFARAFVTGLPLATEKLFAHRFHRPFSIEDYAPVFIVNPCERPVEAIASSTLETSAGLPGALLPAGSDDESFKEYLAGRAPFLREFIALDYEHFKDGGAAKAQRGRAAATAPGRTSAAAPEAKEPSGQSDEAVLDFAVGWIAQRTGFPKTSISPEMKLRDDLNLDSIKVGELVFMICRKLDKKAPADPSAFANARLDKLIAIIQSDFKQEQIPGTATAAATEPGAAGSLGDWVRTFQVERAAMPLSEETYLPIPNLGSAFVVGDPECARVRAIASRLERKGLTPVVSDAESLTSGNKAPENFSLLVLVLSGDERDFLECSPGEFDARVEGTATTLFRMFRWAGQGRDASWKHLRCLVARPRSADRRNDDDLDAGKAFMKTLRLEHSAVQCKWLSLPGEWSAEQWANVIEKEIQTTGSRVFFEYDADGLRATDMAKPPALSSKGALRLDGKDVVLVTGGAKGVTFELARALALRTGARIVLTGTSPMPSLGDTPGNSEMLEHFKGLDSDGVDYEYIQCDVTDIEAVRATVERIDKEKGRVTGILHGAGVSQLQLLEHMKPETFLRTIRIKTRGLYNLLTAAPPKQLKMLHVVSSVLGKTGMRGQTDYTFANAWLDGAVQTIRASHPGIHCASLGYSVWSETGLGKKLGAVDSLASAGVTSIDTETGVNAYLALLEGKCGTSTFVITGRLGPELERNLFSALPPRGARFLQNVLRYAPGVEIVADSALSHSSDRYLPEHVFEGTPMFPGVLAIEAVVEAAMACTGRDELPVVRNVEFRWPIIVPEDGGIAMRVLAVADPPDNGVTRVRVAIRSDADGFQENALEAECLFGLVEKPSQDIPGFPETAETIAKCPEEFSPVPLFQGKFLRRITEIRKRAPEDECVTEILIPDGERYFSADYDQATRTPFPAARDSFLQSGLLILPAGSLPARMGEIRFHASAPPGSRVLCHVIVRERSEEEFTSDLAVYNTDGELVETMTSVVTRTPRAGARKTPRLAAKPIPPARAREDLAALLPESPHALVIIDHTEVRDIKECDEISAREMKKLLADTPAPRRTSVIGNLVAARRAAIEFAHAHGDVELAARHVSLIHHPDGKPELKIGGPTAAREIFAHSEISLADGAGMSVAFVGPAPAGVDIEVVETRNAELWQGLLRDDGYALALRLSGETSESFDCAATRVWTLLEAAKKANGLKRTVPRFEASVGDPWLAFSYSDADGTRDFFTIALKPPREKATPAVLTVALGASRAAEDAHAARATTSASEFDAILADFRESMTRFQPLFADDPHSPDTEQHHEQFLAVIDRMIEGLVSLEKKSDATALYEMRGKLLKQLLVFLDGSDVFRHSLVKPYGYAGDFLLLDKLVQNKCESRGLAYHFDRSQLEYPASVACRNRIDWVCADLIGQIKAGKDNSIRILDIGIGAAPIERRLVEKLNNVALHLIAVDIEPAALEFVQRALKGRNRRVDALRIDLRREDAPAKLGELARDVDACVAVGIIEALRDEEVVRVLSSLINAMPKGAPLYTESFVPTHPTRPHMEWFMDFHLGYRTADEVKALVVQAGAKPENMRSSVDETGSLDFLRVIV